MSAFNFHAIAATLSRAGSPGHPTAILAQELQLYEVEFAALEFTEESKLRAADWAVLALAQSLEEVSPRLVDEYLGLGEVVSEAIVRRLLGDNLLQQHAIPPVKSEGGMQEFFRQFMASRSFFSHVTTATQEPVKQQTQARKLHDSPAPTTPLCQLSPTGGEALLRGTMLQQRTRKARLLFLAEPLLFISVEDEKQQRNTAFKRQRPLPPEDVPKSLRSIDNILSLPASQRLEACGIAASLPGLRGQLQQITPGSQWEVRKATHRAGGKLQPLTVKLVLAAFPSSTELYWRSFLQQGIRMQDCPQLDASKLIEADFVHPGRLLAAINSHLPPPGSTRLRNDGAYELACEAQMLINLSGKSDRPADGWMQSMHEHWHAGLRIHPTPFDNNAAHQAFFAFLQRSDAALRKDFDATCAAMSDHLTGYWSWQQNLPSADEAAIHLWSQPELRAALCMRRLQRDLVTPYAEQEN